MDVLPRLYLHSTSPYGPHDHDMDMPHDLSINGYHQHRKRSPSQETFQEEYTNSFYSPNSNHGHNLSKEPQRKRHCLRCPAGSRCDGVPAMAFEDARQVQKAKGATSSGQLSMADHDRKPTIAEANTLQNTKRNLLKKSDWMGLSAARPLKMAFATVQEMESIGKRRKITVTDRRRMAVILQDSKSYPTANCHRRAGKNWSKNGNNASIPHTEGAGIRIGGDVHQSGTTSPLTNGRCPTPDSSANASAESMLLDRFGWAEPTLRRRQPAECASPLTGDQPGYSPKISVQDEAWPALPTTVRPDRYGDSHFLYNCARASPPMGPSEADTEPLLTTLEQLRDSKSFDEVKARGSSKALTFSHLSQFRPMSPNDMAQDSHDVDNSGLAVKGRRSYEASPNHLAKTPAQSKSSHMATWQRGIVR